MAPTTHRHSSKRIALAAALFAIVVGLGSALALSGTADGKQARVLGKTKAAKPSDAIATGRVTAIQTRLNGKRKPFAVPVNGHLIAWSVDLTKPTKEARVFFKKFLEDKRFGTKPYARLAVLKKQKKSRFKLAKQTKPVNLSSYMGESPIFTLDKPIRVKKGRMLALTAPTWATNYANRASGSQWLASRGSKNCDMSNRSQREKSKPQMKVGSTRKYACRYNGDRVIYRAYIAPSGGK